MLSLGNVSIIASLKDNDEYFLSDFVVKSRLIAFNIETSYDNPTEVGPSNNIAPNLVEDLESFFLICHQTDSSTGLKLYFGVEEEEIKIIEIQDEDPEDKIFTKRIVYSDSEIDKLNTLYGSVEPEFQFSLPPQTEIPPAQNSVKSDELSYDSLSFLGNITNEEFSVTAATGSATGLIIESRQQISDVGGLSGAGRDRTIASTGVSTGDVTVTTSGY